VFTKSQTLGSGVPYPALTSTAYLAFLGPGSEAEEEVQLHLVRENAEVSLCGLPRAGLSSHGHIDDISVCRDCIDWVPKRWTGEFPKATTS
jgi:hypothetical protein